MGRGVGHQTESPHVKTPVTGARRGDQDLGSSRPDLERCPDAARALRGLVPVPAGRSSEGSICTSGRFLERPDQVESLRGMRREAQARIEDESDDACPIDDLGDPIAEHPAERPPGSVSLVHVPVAVGQEGKRQGVRRCETRTPRCGSPGSRRPDKRRAPAPGP